MKMRQKMALIMTFILLLVTATTYAASFTDIDNNPHKEAITEMARLGILEGVGNNRFAPDMELNRAAASKVAALLLGYTEEDAMEAANWEPMFNDVYKGMGQHEWALGWINLMAADGILVGVPGGNYEPESPLQMLHWATIITRILEHEETGMVWPDAYNEMATDLGLTKGLDYGYSTIMNRGEMARMTTTALYEVERPDGKKIIDIVEFPILDFEEDFQDEPGDEDQDIVFYDDANLSIILNNTLVSAGGGQVIKLMATATYGPNNLPAANTRIEFFANAGDQDRRQQLSSTEAITDAQGVATVTYTTLAADDDKQIMFLANIHTDGDWIDKTVYALASNTAAFIQGRVINPFTGSVVSDAKVAVTNEGFYNPVSVSDNGQYSAAVTAGEYYVEFQFNVSGSVPYSGEFYGSHFELKPNGDMRFVIQNNFSSGASYTLPSEMGIMTGTTHSLSPGTDIYIISTGTGQTVIAKINADGRFMITLPTGNYDINGPGGSILKTGIDIEKGKITDVGAF